MNIKKFFNMRVLMGFIFLSFVFSAVYVLIKLTIAPTVAPNSQIIIRVKSDYILMLLQSVFGIVAMLFPGFLIKKVRLSIPSFMLIAYAIFLYCAIYLGEFRSFYYNVPHWDTVLHTFSGAMLGSFGFSFITILNKTYTVPMNLSPLFVAVFTFCFAVSLGSFWEIYEFSADYIFHTNMQKYMLENGTRLIGQDALMDTMKDLMVDIVGAFVISSIGYVSLRYKKGWMEMFQMKITK